MKRLILYIFLSHDFICFGLNNEIEKLINKASEIVVSKDFKYYNLVDLSFSSTMQSTDTKNFS